MKNKKRLFIIVAVIGVALLLSGVIAEVLLGESRYLGFALGFGTGITLVAIGNLIMMKLRPQMKQEEEINEKDERMVQIRGRAAQSTFYLSLFGMIGVIIALLFLDMLVPCFIVLGLMALHVISYFSFIAHYEKTM